MDTAIVLNGYISRFYIDLNYGFIEAEDGNSYFLNHDSRRFKTWKEARTAYKYRAGDQVVFKTGYDEKGRRVAIDVKFVQNEKRDKLIAEANECSVLQGYLKKIDEDYFVKHINTYIFVPVKISEWETNLELVYEDRIDNLVIFELQNIKKPHSLYATLPDRLLKPEYAFIEEQWQLKNPIQVQINGRNAGGYFCTFINTQISCYCKFLDEADKVKNGEYEQGDIINVLISRVSSDSLMVSAFFYSKEENISEIDEKTT